MLPSLFVSHGSPQVLIEDSAARDFLRGFAATNEHLMPLFIGLGAGDGAAGRRVHTSTRSSVISMDTYMFG
jgi:aromatic ring-opening dioxygenase catalytic subunit (LigB family)